MSGLSPERSVFIRNLIGGLIPAGFGGVGLVTNLDDRSGFLWSAAFALAGLAIIGFAILTHKPDR